MRMRFNRRRVALAATAVSLAVAVGTGFVHGNYAAAAATATAPPDAVVTIHAYSFDPAHLTIARGARIVWINRDEDVHTIKSQDGPEGFQSPALDSGGRFELRFRHAGTYHYICSVHPFMHGAIVVR
jgi:plastocyanin